MYKTEDALAAGSFHKSFHEQNLRAYWLIVVSPPSILNLAEVVAREPGTVLKHRPDRSCYRHDLILSVVQARKPVMKCKLTITCKLICFLEPHRVLCTQPRISCICLQSSQALHKKNPPPQNQNALRATSWGDPSSPVPGTRKRPPPPLPPFREALDFVMVTPPPETRMYIIALMAPARAAVSLNLMPICPNPKQLPKP